MPRTDRGPLLSSLVLVGLATMATALLVLIGVQAVKPFGPREAGGTGPGGSGEDIISVPSRTTAPPKTQAPAPGPTTPGPVGSTADRTQEPDRSTATATRRPSSGGTATTTAPKPRQTTSPPKPATSSPAPQPSQSTPTNRPTPPPAASPSPTCTATDRSGKCKKPSDGTGASPAASQPGTAERAGWSGGTDSGKVKKPGRAAHPTKSWRGNYRRFARR